MHCRFFGSAASQNAEGTRDAVDEATKLPLPSGQPRGAGTSRRITVDMHFLHSTPSYSLVAPPPPPASPPRFPRPPRHLAEQPASAARRRRLERRMA